MTASYDDAAVAALAAHENADRFPFIAAATVAAWEATREAAKESLHAIPWATAQAAAEAAPSVADCQERCSLTRCVLGNPFRPVSIDQSWRTWNDGTIVKAAQSIYDECAFDGMPILADVLEGAGCANQDLLKHCRQPGEHVRGCWVVDLILGKE